MIAYPIIVRYSRRGHNKWVYDNYLYSPKGAAPEQTGIPVLLILVYGGVRSRLSQPLSHTPSCPSPFGVTSAGTTPAGFPRIDVSSFLSPCINTTVREPCLEAFSNVDFMVYFPVLPIVFTSIANFPIFPSGVEALNLSLLSLSRYTLNPFLASFLAASFDLSMSLPFASCRAASLARLPCRVSYRADVRGN